MVGINPSNIKYQKITFGAYDTAPETPIMAVSDETIPNDPYTYKHGTKLQDHRGLLGNFVPEKKKSEPEYDSYVNQNENQNQSYDNQNYSQNPIARTEQAPRKKSLLKPLVILAGLTVGGVVAYKKRKPIAAFFKKIFNKKTAAVIEEPTRTGLKMEPNRISTSKFNKYYEDAMKKAYTDEDLNAIKLDNLQVIMSNKVHSVKDKRKNLENLYELSEIYNHKDHQAKITLIMHESMKDKADFVVTMFEKNRIDEVDDKLIKQIEGFKILNVKRTLADKHYLIADSEVRYGVNAGQVEDVATKWWRNIKDFFKGIL